MDAKDRTKTVENARRLIKSRMQHAICEAKVAEVGPNDRIWGPMLTLAGGFLEEAQRDWNASVSSIRMPQDALLAAIVEATAQATREAAYPYRSQCDATWTQGVLDKFLATFDPAELLPPAGQA